MDIGANEGLFSLIFKTLQPNCLIYAFEPAPKSFKRFRINISLNNFSNIIIEKSCLGSYEGSTKFYNFQGPMSGLSSLRPPSNMILAPIKVISVPITTIDCYVKRKKIENLDFIKIDVEGGELDVLKGGVDSIKKINPIIMSEIQDLRTKNWNYKAFEIYQFLKLLNYNWYKITEKGFLKEVSLNKKDNIDYENLVAIPQDKENTINDLLLLKRTDK